ncbi:putative mitochondrial protein [Sesamum angolense]|uniref:Mitochondrial protein n=1 Tax=Sesamum angolense TaxID=2727404 RepID=A0AAE2C063_9LAMI|nr:putative mitochondrial protein [Sesamum angolense]
MVMRVERQRKVHLETTEMAVSSAMYVRGGDQDRSTDKDTCFKIHSIPDWYKELAEERREEDQKTKEVLAVGKHVKKLFYLNSGSFSPAVKAMQQEIKGLEGNDTWVVTDLPPNKRAINCKWVYKSKLNPDGSVDRYKARLIAKGNANSAYKKCTDPEDMDYVKNIGPKRIRIVKGDLK